MNTSKNKMNPKKITNYRCNYCNNYYSTNSNLNKHIDNRCKIKKQNAIEKNKLLETLMEQLEDQKIKIEKLEEQIKEISKL